MATLPAAVLADIRNGRARLTRSGRVVYPDTYRAPFAAGISLTENPNRGKRHTGRLPGMTSTDMRTLTDKARGETVALPSYVPAAGPLTVSQPALDIRGRRNPRGQRSSYTV